MEGFNGQFNGTNLNEHLKSFYSMGVECAFEGMDPSKVVVHNKDEADAVFLGYEYGMSLQKKKESSEEEKSVGISRR